MISFLETRIAKLLSKHRLKLIIIDSIAALFRVEFETWELSARAKALATIGKLLHKLSHQYKICILCVNQVRDIVPLSVGRGLFSKVFQKENLFLGRGGEFRKVERNLLVGTGKHIM